MLTKLDNLFNFNYLTLWANCKTMIKKATVDSS